MIEEEFDQEIAVIRGEIWDNCMDWCYKCDVNIPENFIDENGKVVRGVPRCPSCNKVMGFIPKAGIDEYLKKLDPDEREAREKGIWAHLSGLVYKMLDREEHVYKDFQIPSDWMKVEGVDPHDARPTHWLFGAVSPEEVEIFGRKRNRIYFYDYLLLKDGDIESFVKQIKSRRALHGYENPSFVVLDAKFGAKKEMEFKTWQGELEKHGIKKIRLSHSAPGDVELGHKIVKEYLKPQFSSLDGARPGMMFAKEACSGASGPINYMFNYQYKDDGKGKPVEKYKDWCDCYDSETEILTNIGWKYFKELDQKELVATLNENMGIEFQKPTDYFNMDYSGEMIKFKGRSIDLMVTPNHRMIVANGGGYKWPDVRWKFRKASDVSKWMLAPVSSNGMFDTENGIEDAWYEFMGWYLSEGSSTGTRGGKIQIPGRGYSIYISQTEQSPHIEEIHRILKSLPWNYWYNGRSFVISNKALWEQLYPLGHSGQKHIPEELFSGNKKQLQLLWECMVKGDGWERKKTNCNVKILATTSKQLANDTQRLLSLLGKNSSIKTRQPSDSFLRGRQISKDNCKLQYWITEKSNDIAHFCDGEKSPNFQTVDYEGGIHCVTVPNHRLLVRRNGKPIYCGNCVRYVAMERPIYQNPQEERDFENYLVSQMNHVKEVRRTAIHA